MKKLKEAHDTASNGLEAFEKYKKAPGIFKIIIMGMPDIHHFPQYPIFLIVPSCSILSSSN